MRTNELVAWLRRTGPATANQIAFAFGLRYDTAVAWLSMLVGEGKVRSARSGGTTTYSVSR